MKNRLNNKNKLFIKKTNKNNKTITMLFRHWLKINLRKHPKNKVTLKKLMLILIKLKNKKTKVMMLLNNNNKYNRKMEISILINYKKFHNKTNLSMSHSWLLKLGNSITTLWKPFFSDMVKLSPWLKVKLPLKFYKKLILAMLLSQKMTKKEIKTNKINNKTNKNNKSMTN